MIGSLALTGVALAVPPEVITVLDIAHSTYFSSNMMSRTPTDAANWLVDNHLTKASTAGVTLIIFKNPYRWQPEPIEEHPFGGTVSARRTALHTAISNAKAAHRAMPKLCIYQSMPAGTSLSSADSQLLAQQAAVFDEDAWDESIGAKAWQQAMIDQRRLTRVQHLEPVWDSYYTAQFTYPIDGTEDMLSWPITQWQCYPSPRPQIRCSFYRPVVPLVGESTHDAAVRTIRQFHAYCIPKNFTPVDPLHAYTMLGVVPAEVYTAVCAGDYDGNGFVNGLDFDQFFAEFMVGHVFADFDGNGFVNGDDMDAYLVHYMSGC